MDFHSRNLLTVLFAVSIFLNSGFRHVAATRPLEGEQWLKEGIVLESLQKGPAPPSHPSPCTYIPGPDPGHCTLEERNFAGNVAHARPTLLKEGLVLESLQKGPVPPSSASNCTHIPGTNPGHCTLEEKNFARNVARAPPTFPKVNFAAASSAN